MKLYKYLFITILYFLALKTQGQDITIEGYLFDKNNEPVIGATIVLEDNRQIGTVSDVDGAFTIALPYQYQGRYLIISAIENLQDKKIIINTSYSKPFRIIRLEDYHPINIRITHLSYPVEIKEHSFWEKIKNPPKPKHYLLGTIPSPSSFLKTRKVAYNPPPFHKRVWWWITRPFR